jgi:hypothetical protein
MATPSRTAASSMPGGGWVAFAGIMLILAGAIDFFNGIWAVGASNATDDAFDAWAWDNLTAWGVIYILLGIALIVTGFFIFQRAPWAVMVGIVAGTVGAIIHSFWLFSFPIASLILVIINILVVYGLVVYGTAEDEPAY